jgi:hypothetical protein
MSSETDHPRQRTVAELLAAHGDGNVSGRRRRRREPDDEPEEGADGALAADPSDWRSAPPDGAPERAAPGDGLPPAPRDNGGRRRTGAEPGWLAEQRPPEQRPPEQRPADRRPVEQRPVEQRPVEQRPVEQRPVEQRPVEQRPVEQRPAERRPTERRPAEQRSPERSAGQPAAQQRGADPWGVDEQGSDDWASERWDAGQWDQDSWDAGHRESPGWEARPAQESWDGPAREARYADPEPREAAPRRARRAPEDRDAVDDAPSWEPREPSRSWEAREEPRRSREREEPAWEAGGEPERNGRDPRSRDPRARAPRSWDVAEPEAPPIRAGVPPVDERVPARPIRDLPTDKMPQVPGVGSDDPGVTSRIKPQRRRPEPDPDELDDDGPATMVGAAPPGSEAWHRARTEGRRRPPDPDADLDPDDGPATMVGAAPPGSEAWHRARTEGRRRDVDGGPPTQASAPLPFDDDEDDDYPAGLDRQGIGEEPTGFFAAEDEQPELPAKRRSAQTEATEQAAGAQGWAAVIAQWIAGAIGGAALWVGFRFLWRDLPVVATAAAVLVTVGLVVVVRALLRSSDLRTTLFAVLVGLLLTVSPAILVLLGR